MFRTLRAEPVRLFQLANQFDFVLVVMRRVHTSFSRLAIHSVRHAVFQVQRDSQWPERAAPLEVMGGSIRVGYPPWCARHSFSRPRTIRFPLSFPRPAVMTVH